MLVTRHSRTNVELRCCRPEAKRTNAVRSGRLGLLKKPAGSRDSQGVPNPFPQRIALPYEES
jgi:hypothetical protein